VRAGDVPIGGDRSWHPAGSRIWLPEPEVGALAVHGVTLGHGPHLLLLHGFVQASWCWRDVLEPLARDHTVHAICVPGFGWSDKPRGVSYRLVDQAARVARWLDAMAIEVVDVVGCSLGGALALQLALDSPARVGRLVLVNPAGAGRYPMSMLAALQHERLAPLLRLPGVPLGLRTGLRTAAYAELPIDAHYMAHFLAPLRTDGAGEAALRVARTFNADLRALDARLDAVAAPTLVLRGGRDRVVPESIVRRVAQRVPQARWLRYDAAAHCPMEEMPGRFVDDVRDFLATAPR
jgi:pimeloyl-ACP methyl ester carboxylesterase